MFVHSPPNITKCPLTFGHWPPSVRLSVILVESSVILVQISLSLGLKLPDCPRGRLLGPTVSLPWLTVGHSCPTLGQLCPTVGLRVCQSVFHV